MWWMKWLNIICIWMALLLLYSCNDLVNSDYQQKDLCPDDPYKMHPGVCGCGKEDVKDAVTGLYACMVQTPDLCPNDPQKTEPGYCGCGIVDVLDKQGQPLCLMPGIDLCPEDENKQTPGICGCGVEDSIDPSTGIPHCLSDTIDLCANGIKRHPGICGCDVEDIIDPETGVPFCLSNNIDFCPHSEIKTRPGVCGCDVEDVDSDADTVADCIDECADNPLLTQANVCGCVLIENEWQSADDDGDTIPNCLDACPDDAAKFENDGCSCQENKIVFAEREICAVRIQTAEEFLKLRDNWNQADLDEELAKSYVLTNDIEIPSALLGQDKPLWTGIGTLERPFDGLFIANEHEIAFTNAGEVYEIKTPDDAGAVFAYTSGAKIDGLRVRAKFSGDTNLALIVGKAEKTALNNVTVSGELQGTSQVGGIAGYLLDSSIEAASADLHLRVNEEDGGALVGRMENSTANRVAATGEVLSEEGSSIGGLIGYAGKATKVYNAYYEGKVDGGSDVGGLIGKLSSRSDVLNVYTISTVQASKDNVGGLIGQVNEFCRISNAYALAAVSVKNNVKFAGALIGLIPSKDNSKQSLYYWENSGAPGAIGFSEVDYTEMSFAFTLLQNTLKIKDTEELLLNALNNKLSCIDDVCKLDGVVCNQWSGKPVNFEGDELHVPTLQFQPEQEDGANPEQDLED
jgi:hypothetical protein